MKARFLALVALVLGLASCQKDTTGFDVVVDGEQETTISVSLPEATRANSAQSGLQNVDLDNVYNIRYILEIYDGTTRIKRMVNVEDKSASTAFDVRLIPGYPYTFVAWADFVDQNKGLDEYDVNGVEKDMDLYYNTADGLTAVTANFDDNGKWVAMTEARDAYTGKHYEDSYSSASNITIPLVRPFAKLRVVTTDVEVLKNLGDVTTTNVSVDYRTKVYTGFNALTEEPNTAEDLGAFEYVPNVYTETNQTDLTLLADYLFGTVNGTIQFDLTATFSNGKETSTNFNTDIPLYRNKVTTIKGNILTDGSNIKVDVGDDFENPNDPNYEYKTISSAAEFYAALNNGGQYIVISDLGITSTPTTSALAATRSTNGKTVNINLNGKKITVDDNVTITIPENTTLTIKDESENGEGSIEIRDTDQDDTNNNGVFVNNGTINLEGGNLDEGVINNTANGNVTITNDNIDNNVVTGNTDNVTNYAKGLEEAFTNGGEYTLGADVTLNKSLTLAAGKNLVLKLGGNTIFGKTSGNTNPQDMMLIKGNLTVENGTIIVEHVGDNMGWNGQATIFDITAGGVVSLNTVTAKHLGGSDMNFVAHLNNWGEATFNAEKCTLEATYIAVRAFNSGYDMNNVTIKNSTLKGKYCFLVHNYKEAGDGSGTDATLNIDIYNGNTFEYTGKAPILYGFNEPLYFDAEGKLLAFNAADLAKFTAKESQRSEVALANDIELNEQLNIAKEFTLDLNGKTITGTDTITGSFGLITNKGNLTVKNGKMTLVAENNRGWNAYSSVISNNPGGNLVVEDVTIEHLGGTDMAYGIDNLTNGKSTSAVATINEGAIVKSPYRAVRMFLNGIEANNSLTVNAGAVIEGANKSIWMQDPSKNANTGTLIVNEGATLNGDVYLYVCEGSTEWPVSVSIAASAVNGEILTGNVPEAYVVVNTNGVWTVKSKALVDFEAAIAKGGNVTLDDNVEISEPIVVTNSVVIDLNGNTVTAPSSSAFVANTGAELTIKNGKVVAYESTVRAIGGKAIVESGEYTSTGTALDSPATYRYSLDCREGGELIINGGTFKSNNGMINVSSTVTINGGKFENIVEKSMTRHFAYVSAPLTINDGEFLGKANSGAGGCFFCGAASTGEVVVNGGKFTSLWTSGSVNRIFEVYFGGTINVTGGLFNTNGGIATFVTENTDEATKAAYPYVAK